MGLTQAGKNFSKRLLMGSGLVPLLNRMGTQGVVILRYHSVLPDPKRFENSIGIGIIHSTADFQEQMEIIARRYVPISLDDVLDFLSGGKLLPRKSVAVTFDDGFADNHEFAAPILNRAGVPASFYIAVSSIEAAFPPWYCRLRFAFAVTAKTSWIDSVDGCTREMATPEQRRAAFLTGSKRCAQLTASHQEKTLRAIENELDVKPLSSRDCPMLTWDQIRSLRAMGHIVGSHTLTHPNLAYIGSDDLHLELEGSKKKLDGELGAATRHFSYPSPILEPHYNDRTITCTREVGYRTAVTCTSGPVRAGHDPLKLRRISAPAQRDDFRWALESTFLGRRL